jgi:hypothetical protein
MAIDTTGSIIVVEQNEGEKLPYVIGGNKITFGDDELTLNVSKHERDEAAHIDVCRDIFGNLVTGVIPGLADNYAAQIDIPPRENEYSADGEDEEGNPQEICTPIPFDIKNVL